MSLLSTTTRPPAGDAWPGRTLLDGTGRAWTGWLREAAHRAVWAPALRWCGGVTVAGATLDRPAVYVANHCSHADTVAVRAAFPSRDRRRLAVAAADDYFFATRSRAVAFSLAVGAFPFPRHGDAGLQRATALLESGWSVLLYPQGTRSGDGSFRPGVLRLAAQGWTVVPVGLAGTGRVLPKGATWPKRHPMAVVFSAPLPPHRLTGSGALERLAAAVQHAAAHAEARLP